MGSDMMSFGTVMEEMKRQLDIMFDAYKRLAGGRAASSRLDATAHRFKTTELSYFYPNCPESCGSDMIIFANREIIYREVYAFTDRMHDCARATGDEDVRQKPPCLLSRRYHELVDQGTE